MTFEFLKKYQFLSKWINQKIGYYAHGLYEFNENRLVSTNENNKRIIIIAKKHYRESLQAFTSINKKELKKIIEIKKKSPESKATIYQITENNSIDGFDVKAIVFERELLETLGYDNVLIPETELFHIKSKHISQVETPLGMIFTAEIGKRRESAYAQGIIANIDTYKLSAGLPMDTQLQIVKQTEFVQFLKDSLYQQTISNLSKNILVDPRQWINTDQLHWLYWAPLLSILVFYTFTNSYLAYSIRDIESKLSDGGDKVNQLIEVKKQVDSKNALLGSLSDEFKGKSVTHNYFNIIYKLLDVGATITRISYSKGELTIRAKAEKASAILAAISDYEWVERASFNGPVRSSRGVDVFILTVIPKEHL
ncbi:hypothetical protein AAD001_11530 [Colwelliaceae bacterium 6471]